MFKKGYLYCYIPVCEIKLYCIDITYDYNYIKNKELIYCKKIYNPNIVKKIFYNEFKNELLICNIFSSKLDIKKIKNFFDKIKRIY